MTVTVSKSDYDGLWISDFGLGKPSFLVSCEYTEIKASGSEWSDPKLGYNSSRDLKGGQETSTDGLPVQRGKANRTICYAHLGLRHIRSMDVDGAEMEGIAGE